MMVNFKQLILAFLVFISSTLSQASVDWDALERQCPEQFAGFSATNMDMVNALRLANRNAWAPCPEMQPVFVRFAEKLNGHNQFLPIRREIRDYLDNQPLTSLMHYYYFVMKVATHQQKPSAEEEAWFRLNSFPHPYELIKDPAFLASLNNIPAFEDYVRHTKLSGYARLGSSPISEIFRHAVEPGFADYIYKSPYASIAVPLPGEGILGYFYLAWFYAQGIHALPLPLDDQASELHDIQMGRYAKFCHDIAHHQNDRKIEAIDRFTEHLMARSYKLSPTEGDHLPKFAEFATAIQCLYSKSLESILLELLQLYKPDPELFKAISVGAYIAMQDDAILGFDDGSGMPRLEDMLNCSVSFPDEDDTATNRLNPLEESLFKGLGHLSDQELSQKMIETCGSYFNDPTTSQFDTKLEADVSDKVVQLIRNDYATILEVEKPDGRRTRLLFPTYKFLFQLAGSKHDNIFIQEAAPALKRIHGFIPPAIPNIQDYQEEAAYVKDFDFCRQQQIIAKTHLKRLWLDFALKTIKQTTENTIAQRFTDGYTTALHKLATAFSISNEEMQTYINEAIEPYYRRD